MDRPYKDLHKVINQWYADYFKQRHSVMPKATNALLQHLSYYYPKQSYKSLTSTLSKIENGRFIMRSDLLCHMCQFYGVSLAVLESQCIKEVAAAYET